MGRKINYQKTYHTSGNFASWTKRFSGHVWATKFLVQRSWKQAMTDQGLISPTLGQLSPNDRNGWITGQSKSLDFSKTRTVFLTVQVFEPLDRSDISNFFAGLKSETNVSGQRPSYWTGCLRCHKPIPATIKTNRIELCSAGIFLGRYFSDYVQRIVV